MIEAPPRRWWQTRPVRWSAVSGALLGFGLALDLAGVPDRAITVLYIVSTVVGARFFAIEAVKEFIDEREIGIELLMTSAAVVAASLGLWGEAASLAFLYSISEALEESAEVRTRNAIAALMDLAPRTVFRLAGDGREQEISLDDLQLGDRFVVRPGGSVATDGVIVEGTSSIDESAVTGESIPREVNPGDHVFAGTLNSGGGVVIEATATRDNNTLARVVALVSEAQEAKGRGQRFMERFSAKYSPAVLAAGALLIALGGFITGDWGEWTLRAATLVVAAAPCALVISIPVTYVAAIGSAGRRGILVKGGAVLEDLASIKVVAADKTGTLTRGVPEVVEIVPATGQTERSVLAASAALEHYSEHPLGRAIRRASDDARLEAEPAADFVALPGIGVEATVAGGRALLGRPDLISQRGVDLTALSPEIDRMELSGYTAVVLAVEGVARGVIAISDVPRAEAGAAIAELKSLGVSRFVMLTGDNPRAAAAIATQLGVDEVFAGLLPDQKAARIASLTETDGHVAMVGDGVNDAPALAAASVGVAMGAAGTDIAIETADLALMADDLSKLPDAVKIARRTRSVVRQNLALSFVVLVVLVPTAVTGVINLPTAVLGHELSELVVILSGLRMARA